MTGEEFVVEGMKRGNFQPLILEALGAQDFLPIEWVEVPVAPNASVFVLKDSLRVGIAGDAVRVNVTARTAQRIADTLGLLLPSTRIMDRAYEMAAADALVIEPRLQPPDRATRIARGLSASMADARAMQTHSRAIDALVMKRARIILNTGKDWVVTGYFSKKKTGTAANYGWYSQSAPNRSASGHRMWQPLGFAHNVDHTDYSQTLRLVHPTMMHDGKRVSVADVASGPSAHLVLSDGPCPGFRIPWLARASQSEDVREPDFDSPTLADPAPLVTAFVEAKNFGAGGNKYTDRSAFIKHIVIHTAEINEAPTSAEALAKWASGASAPQASWHYGIDSDSIVQCVKDEHIAWHAPGCNKTGIGIELAGRASQTKEQWQDEFSRAVLDRLCRLLVVLCQKWNIPVVSLVDEDLIAGKAGITQHREVSAACRIAQSQKLTSSPFYNKKKDAPLTNHYDPGPYFPMDEVIRRVREGV